jgi:hypothetical protein
VRQAFHPGAEAQLVEGRGHVGVGHAGLPVADVVGHGGVEQEAVLRHHHHPLAQGAEGDGG